MLELKCLVSVSKKQTTTNKKNQTKPTGHVQVPTRQDVLGGGVPAILLPAVTRSSITAALNNIGTATIVIINK